MVAASSISGDICIMEFTPEREAKGRNLTPATSPSRKKEPYIHLKPPLVATARYMVPKAMAGIR